MSKGLDKIEKGSNPLGLVLKHEGKPYKICRFLSQRISSNNKIQI